MSEFTKAQLDAAIKEAVDGLKSKNKELLKDNKELKVAINKFDGIDVDELKQAAEKLKEIETQQNEEKGEYKKLYEKAQQTIETLKNNTKTETTELQQKVVAANIDKHLALSLVGAGVEPELVDAASSLIGTNATQTDDGKIVVGDVELGDFMKEWTTSKVGQRFIGDGNNGNGMSGPGNTDTRAELKYYDKNSPDFSVTEQAKIANKDVALHKRLVDQAAKIKPAS